jgi:CBS domain-containing protein
VTVTVDDLLEKIATRAGFARQTSTSTDHVWLQIQGPTPVATHAQTGQRKTRPSAPSHSDAESRNTHGRVELGRLKLLLKERCVLKSMRIVKEMMKPVLRIGSQQTVLEAAKLMSEFGRSSLVVMEGNIAVGIVTEKDFITRVVAENLPYTTLVSQVMSSPLRTVDASTPLKQAARIMFEHKIRRLPVVEGGVLAGIIVASDFLCQLSKKTLTEEIWGALASSPL